VTQYVWEVVDQHGSDNQFTAADVEVSKVGALVFTAKDGGIVHAFAPGTWVSVTLVDVA